ncbi:hypothetical protein M885DRAFT_542440 [Pelagophyceae sp. CCMP2097]|nr:hypothetical protein M885DRAFT_542440 [Pelagophyceae sp. CCMP2097]
MAAPAAAARVARVRYAKRGVGKRLKGTKKHHTWELAFGASKHRLDVWRSKVSGNVRVRFDAQDEDGGANGQTWNVDGHSVRLAFEAGRPVVFIDEARFEGAPTSTAEETAEAFEAGLDATQRAKEKLVLLPPLLFSPDCPAATNSLLAAEADRSILARALPKRLRDRRLRSRFAARNDGYDLPSLVRCCASWSRKPVVVIVQTTDGSSFGCFIGEAPFLGHASRDVVEDGESAVFRFGKHAAAFPRDKLDWDSGTYINAGRAGDFFGVALCGSEANAALRIDGRLSSGTSSNSKYFDSPPLHTDRDFGEDAMTAAEEEFEIADVEVFSFEVPPPL